MEAAGIEPASPLTQDVTNQGVSEPPITDISECISFLEQSDTDLARIVCDWPNLSDHAKTIILSLIKSGGVSSDASE